MMLAVQRSRWFVMLGLCLILFLNLAASVKGASQQDYRVVETVPGKILDYDSNRILYYKSNSQQLYVRNLTTKLDTLIVTGSIKEPAYLTERGAVYMMFDDVYQWYTSGTPRVKLLANGYRPIVKKVGKFLLLDRYHYIPGNHYVMDDEIWTYDLTNDTLSYIDTGEYSDISEDGHLVYVDQFYGSGTIKTYFNGVYKTLYNMGVENIPVTNGERILSGSTVCCNNSHGYKISLMTYTYETQELKSLENVDESTLTYYRNYQQNNNWIVYEQIYGYDTTSDTYYLITPDGITIPIPKNNDDSNFEHESEIKLNKNGEVVFSLPESNKIQYTNPSMNGRTIAYKGPDKGFYKITYNESNRKWYGVSTGNNLSEFIEVDFNQSPSSTVKFDFNSLLQWVDEGSGTVTANVYRVGGSTGSLTVDYTTEDDTAKAGNDYVAASGKLTFADGETVKTIQIQLLDDTAKELPESFSLKLIGPSNVLSAPETNRSFFMIRDNEK
ncbi:Calx-beta domain-containing protein [Paenibacillus sp. SI8]|uniref:Calx-beta domain-containing protein n=1 Tax=unclassified Paenibacillus TaxID=185978 RepID=UPI0034664736